MDPAHPSPTPTPAASPRRRGCLGCLFQGGLGCAAFLVGSVAAAGLFAPTLLGGVMSELLEKAVAGRIAGRIAIEDLELAWKGRQRAGHVELLDPDGQRVGTFELTLPSLLTLLGSDQDRWEVHLRVKTADVKLDADGGSNLARALAAPPGGPTWSGTVEGYDSRRGYAQRFPYLVRLTGDDVRLEGLAAQTIELDGVSLVLEHLPDGRDTLGFAARVQHGAQSGQVEGTLAFEHPPDSGPVRGAPWRGADYLRLDGTLDRVPTSSFERLAALPLDGLFGPALSGSLAVVGDREQGREVTVSLQEDALRLEGSWKDGVLAGRGPELTASLPLPPTWLEDLLADHLPEGTRVLREGEARAPWSLEASGLRLPLGQLGGPWPTRADLLAGLGGVFELRAPAGLTLLDDAQRELVRLAQPRLTLALGAGQAPRLELVDSPAPGGLVARLDGRRDLTHTIDERAFSVDLEAAGVGVDLLDHLRGSDGLLPALFGPSASVHFERPVTGPALLRLRDEGGRELVGRLEGTTLVGGEEDRASLLLDLRAGPARTLVSDLVPWLEQLESVEGGAPARLVLERYRLPVEGALSGAQAVVRLDLGDVRYRLHPGMHEIFFPPGTPHGSVEVRLPVLRMRVDPLIVRYDELVIAPSADEQYDFTGTLLRSGEISLRCEEMPLRYTTSMALPAGGDTLVQATLGGTWDDPALLMDTRVLESLTTGLGTLLERLGAGKDEDG